MKLTHPLVVLDLETTGTWIEKDRIIEIGMIKCLSDGGRETFVRRVNPGIAVPPAVTRLTGISDADLKDCPAFRQIAAEVLCFIGDADFAGFNVERFDLPLLEREVFDTGLRLEWRHRTVYDAQKIYHIHEKRDLTAAYKFFCKKDLQNAYSALGDTEAALEILEAQIAKYGSGNPYVEALIDFDYEPPADFFDADRKFRWWNGELYPVFGKYGRKFCLREILEKDRAYVEYLITTDFDDTVKEMLKSVLQGKFPRLGEPDAR
jgi:DNA polymerase-3 subunit epsilon